MSKFIVDIPEPVIARFLWANTLLSPLWLILRVYVGWQWLDAGWHKVNSSVWVGEKAGTAVSGFLNGALAKSAGEHSDVSGWYAWFIEHVALPNASIFSHLVAYGEVLVGIALILGLFTGVAAIFGASMNANYLFAGTVSTNPLLFIIQIVLILAWRTAGWIGLDRWILPLIGTPWQPGKMFKSKQPGE